MRDGLLRSRRSPDLPEWRVPPTSHQESAPPEGYVVSFNERGLGVLLRRFMRAILHYYGVELHHLAPNSISQATIFVAVYEGYLGVEPHWKLWLHLFKAEHFAKKAGQERSASGDARWEMHDPGAGGSR
jgi:acetamidase/formamidase